MTLREICETLEVSRRAIQGYENAGLVKATGGPYLMKLLAILNISVSEWNSCENIKQEEVL